MDDMLEWVQQGAASHVELRSQSFALASADRDFIRSKVGKLKSHAQRVLEGLKKQADESDAEAAALQAAAAPPAAADGSGGSNAK